MSWTTNSPNSRVFTQALLSPLTRGFAGAGGSAATGFASLAADTINAALFNNTTTPDASAAVGSTGYNTGVWVTGNEVIDTLGANWPAGGLALGTKAVSITTAGGASTPSVISFTAANTGSGSNVTITAAFGALVYDSTITAGTVAKQGLCFNYFGGTQGVTAGTFTVVWDPSGVFKLSNT